MNTIPTEKQNEESRHFDKMTTEKMAETVVCANYDAVRAVENALPSIAKAVDAIAVAFASGKRLLYVGAGTSGRLGVLDAAECPPTFGVSYEAVEGILAGGNNCMFCASENAEDSYENGVADITAHGACDGDVVCGISASGNAAYVIGALEQAKKNRCITVALSCNPNGKILCLADFPIFTDTGAEVVVGSTRLKAGTAQKIVLNTLTTCAMTKNGRVYENKMICLRPTNKKLRERMIRIVGELLECDETEAIERLETSNWDIKTAVENAKSEKTNCNGERIVL